jgi:ABC-2 type transport system ATP-binding protein
MENVALEISGMRKTYSGGVEALKGIDLQVPAGCIYGLLGPNGAGKSTLVKILTTLIRSSGGSGQILGRKIGDRSTLKEVGLLPEHARFPDYLTGRQVIEFSAGLNDVPVSQLRSRTDHLLERVGMAETQHRKIKSYSKGMKQRIGIAQALINDPKIIFLDEPTDGVDPSGRRDIQELVRELRSEGKTVFINTHLLPELETVVDRVAIMSNGVLLGEGPLEALRTEEIVFQIEYEGVLSEASVNKIRSGSVHWEVGKIEVTSERASEVQPIIDLLRSENLVIGKVHRQQQSLEDLFLGLVAKAQATPPPLA